MRRSLTLVLLLLMACCCVSFYVAEAQATKRTKLAAYDASNLTTLNASELTTGTIPTNVLPTLTFNATGTIDGGSGSSGVTVTRSATGIYELTRSTSGSANVPLLATGWLSDYWSVKTDGVNDYVSATTVSGLSGASAFTFFCKAKLNSTVAQSCALFQQRKNSSAFCGIRHFTDGSAYVYQDSDATNYAAFTAASAGITAGSWYTLAVVYDGSQSGNANRMKVYVNGTQVTLTFTGSVAASFAANDGAFEIGRWNSAGSFTYGNANVARVVVYSTALTAANVQELSLGGDVGSPLLKWEFTNGSGTTVSDVSGNNRNGTLQNGPTWESVPGQPLLARVTNQTTSVSTVEFSTALGVKTNPTRACVLLGR